MRKIAFIVSLIVFSGASTQAADKNNSHRYAPNPLSDANHSSAEGDNGVKVPVVRKEFVNDSKNQYRRGARFIYEPGLGPGKFTYIVELSSPSVLQKPELSVLLERNNDQTRKYAQMQSVQKHVAYLAQKRNQFLQSASEKVGATLVTHYEYVLNGVALRMTQAQAQVLASYPEIKQITRETIYRTTTDRGPTLVGAPALWQGDVASLLQTQGEGVVVGIIDSGINSDHPSFAEKSGDGYLHTNPLGDGVYLGDCANAFPELCNNKLIGVYSYSAITSSYLDTAVFPPNLPQNGEDYDGHGSHVAAIAVGNVLTNLPETLPTSGRIESDGTATGFTFEQISGVAPRANLISYQVCFPGRVDQDDTYAGCPGSVINRGIEDAIRDGVDIINFSISGGGDPWRDSTERAFLSAQSIGIFVATSAGNSGPGVSSSEKHAPWYTSVAASEHGRENAFVKQLRNFSGGLNPPAFIIGQSNTGAISASIVYAGNFNNPNDPGGDAAQCLQAFPPNTFNGQIVVCDRGEIPRVDKAENVSLGGAAGFVLANLQGAETFLANDAYIIPGIHINADDGDRLKQWLATGGGHRVTITHGIATQNIDQARVDVLADFSSRGPNTTIDILNPMMTAPGVQIYSAYADQRFGHDGHDADAGDFNYLSGTSMSSPHVAGAAALLKSLHPNWTADNIRSALAMTAITSVKREDASTPADFFDMGSGRISVDLAAQTGLILDETEAAYIAAEPARGGDPRTLNVPSVTDSNCVAVCTWSRTFTATKNGAWDVSGESFAAGLDVSISPTSFSIQAGQTQTIEVTIDTIHADKNRYIFGQVNLRADNSPDLHLPVSVLSSIGDIPTLISTDASRNADSVLITDIEAITLDNFVLTSFSLTRANVITGQIIADSDTSDYLDNTSDGVFITEIDVMQNAKRLIVEIVSSSAPDLDLYVLFDRNSDGLASSFEEIAQSTSGNSTEEIQVDYPEAGRYFLAIQSFSGSNNPPDSFELRYAVVGPEQDDTLQADAPSSLFANVAFDMRIFYQLNAAQIGDDYYGAIEMGTSALNTSNLGLISVDIKRIANDVALRGNALRVNAGDIASLDLVIAANNTNEERIYDVTIPTIAGARFINIGGGSISAEGLRYVVIKSSGDNTSSVLSFDLRIEQTIVPGPVVISPSSELQNRSGETFQQAPPFTQIQVEGPPSINFDGNTTTSLDVVETRTVVIPISVTDPNQDPITLVFTQTAGPAALISQTAGVSTLKAPSVNTNTLLSFNVAANDGNGNTVVSSFIVKVLNNEAPRITSISAPLSAEEGQRISITVSADDPENDTLTVTINGSIGSSFSASAPRGQTSVSYLVSVSDGINTVTDTVTVRLTPPPSSGGGGSLPIWALVLLSAAVSVRRYCLYRYSRQSNLADYH